MNSYIVVLRSMGVKSVRESRRNSLNTLIGFFTPFTFFLILYFGGQFLASDLLSESTGLLIVSYFLFTMAVSAYSDLTHDLINEAQWGTLEQLTMSPIGFTAIVTTKTIVNLAGTFISGVFLLILMVITTNTGISLAPLSLATVGLLTLLPIIGLGFAFGGAALVYKQIERVFPLVQLSFLGLVVLPVQAYPILKILPVSLGCQLLQKAMVNNIRLWNLPLMDLGILVSKSMFYLIVGIVAFQLATRKARQEGTLGHY